MPRLSTEIPNTHSQNIDEKNALEIVQIMNQEDQTIAQNITPILPVLAKFIEHTVQKLQKGGRLIYIGAGTSGRLGVLDASECPPTFSVSSDLVQGLIAGGQKALTDAIENAEDDGNASVLDLKKINFSKCDVLVGITASGGAAYVIEALKYANTLNATTAAIACNKNAHILQYAQHNLSVDVGHEIIAGSTRLKSGTAQKMILNMISTGVMVRLGKVYDNLMIDIKPSNKKLQKRAKNLISLVANCSQKEAQALFETSGRRVKVAVVMHILGVGVEEAVALIEKTPHLKKIISKILEIRNIEGF